MQTPEKHTKQIPQPMRDGDVKRKMGWNLKAREEIGKVDAEPQLRKKIN